MTARTVVLLDASALLAAANTRVAQVLENGQPPQALANQLRETMARTRAAQLALCDAIQPVPAGRDRVVPVRG